MSTFHFNSGFTRCDHGSLPNSLRTTLPHISNSAKAIHCITSLSRFRFPQSPLSTHRNRHQQSGITTAAAHSYSLLGHSAWNIWACIAFAGAAGLHLERTPWGKELSGALLSTLIGLFLTNIHVIPSEAPHVYGAVNSYLLPLAVPLLLFAADLRKVLQSTGRLLTVFTCGAVSTVIGSIAAFALVPLHALGQDGWKVAAALTARHIGGSVNYMAVSEALQLSANARMAGLAADDLIVAGYFTALYSLARKVPPESSQSLLTETDTMHASAACADNAVVQEESSFSVLHGATALAVSAVLCALGSHIATLLQYRGVLVATAVPRMVAPLVKSGECIAAILMQLFFASVGASGSIETVVKTAPTLFLWSFVAITVHVVGILGAEKWFSFSRKETCLASNANIGGPTTAAGMAAAKGWNSSVIPALLIGICGYATATFVGLGSGALFQRMQQVA